MKFSIICVVRNDGYGIHQEQRTITFLKSLDLIPNKQNYELILVEWNPIKGVEMFCKKYRNFLPRNLKIKAVVVSDTVHNTIHNPFKLPVFEYYGKNVGARNCDGDFLIFTNPDNFFFQRTWEDIANNASDEFFLRLCRSDVRLDLNTFSYDIPTPHLPIILLKKFYHFYGAPGHPSKSKMQDFDELNEAFEWDILHCGASGDFYGVSRKNFEKIGGYREHYTYSHYDSIILYDSFDAGLKQKILPKYSIHIDHSRPHMNSRNLTDEKNPPPKKTNWGLLNNSNIKTFVIQ